MIFSKNKNTIGKLLNDNKAVSIDDKSNNSIISNNTNNKNQIKNKDE